MFGEVERTEYRLVMEYVEVIIVLVVVDQRRIDFSLAMCERTEIAVFA